MGSHSKKHKKTRRRSRSRSRSSEHRHRKSGRRSRSRSVSSSDSSYSHRRAKARRHHRRSRSRSRLSSSSRSRSPVERYTHRRSGSRSKDRYSSKGRRRSRSPSHSRRRSRTRSRTPTRSRRRSRSRSRSTSHGGSHSRHDSKEKAKMKDTDKHAIPAETVKQKMQKALEAAASANEKLKEKGIISAIVKSEPLTLSEEREKQLAIADIEEDSFKASTFLSSHVAPTGAKPAKLSKEQSHDNAIFGGAAVNMTSNGSSYHRRKQIIFYKTVNRGELASTLLAKSSEEKMQAWVEKLQKMRQDKIQANPEYFKKLLTIGNASDI